MTINLLAALGAVSLFTSPLQTNAEASGPLRSATEWVRLDRTTSWAWGVERKTATWHVSDRYVWTVAIPPETTTVENEQADYVIFLHKFNCSNLEVTALAAYAVRTGQSKTELQNPAFLTLPVNERVEETICSLGGVPRQGLSEEPFFGNVFELVASVLRPSTLWDELWLRDARARANSAQGR